ncbi:hypothetical protein L198_07817 [Cryptococcus wingfieldii CBS 7118]|uniref:RNA-dependent RNA polymerase n=1 Tax=Cryptococcus wingfieldii CBS 7118 TaxID=1295528 RepID=A0A1E3HVG8_9TREE|nr:hypothetical protein L198_07817 [Cryptococcus wingfieldii CBS 7118]ODN80317.1 hypothetical protein L198_07817 [Cryptococcus wingfieldii CBS 7118]
MTKKSTTTHLLVPLPSTTPESSNICSSKTANSIPASYSHLATLSSANGLAAAYATAHDNLLFNIVQVAQAWYTGQVVTTAGWSYHLNGRIFTDGVGIAGKLVLHERQGLNLNPSVIQFRLGGAKGVLANWPQLVGDEEIRLRPSLIKITADLDDLNVIRIAKNTKSPS